MGEKWYQIEGSLMHMGCYCAWGMLNTCSTKYIAHGFMPLHVELDYCQATKKKRSGKDGRLVQEHDRDSWDFGSSGYICGTCPWQVSIYIRVRRVLASMAIWRV